ncbi:MAG TPA: DUF3466 family protein, partial [Thiotrichales bacterium]|nr:DUF3466 family protein [Thiotrichales bacterium]
TSPSHAYLYANGSAEDLNRGIFSAVAYDVNDLGQVVGRGWPNQIGQAFLFDNNGVNQNLGTLVTNGQSQANAINNNGQVVGWASSSSNARVAFLYENGSMLDLCVLVDCTAKGWDFFEEATGINDNGDIVGYGSIGGVTRGFVISAVPVPAAAWLFLSGLFGLLGFIRRR